MRISSQQMGGWCCRLCLYSSLGKTDSWLPQQWLEEVTSPPTGKSNAISVTSCAWANQAETEEQGRDRHDNSGLKAENCPKDNNRHMPKEQLTRMLFGQLTQLTVREGGKNGERQIQVSMKVVAAGWWDSQPFQKYKGKVIPHRLPN